ncbi:MAG: hypothetical protein ACKVKP_14745, partial [Acidimicrobiales bacterium]
DDNVCLVLKRTSLSQPFYSSALTVISWRQATAGPRAAFEEDSRANGRSVAHPLDSTERHPLAF